MCGPEVGGSVENVTDVGSMTCWSEFGFNGSRKGWPQPDAALLVPPHPVSMTAPSARPTDTAPHNLAILAVGPDIAQ